MTRAMDQIANYIAIFLGIFIVVFVTTVFRQAVRRICYWTAIALVTTMAVGIAFAWIA
jgi:hypothetical protein